MPAYFSINSLSKNADSKELLYKDGGVTPNANCSFTGIKVSSISLGILKSLL